MLLLEENQRIFIYTESVDMRKAIDGLNLILVETLETSPQSGDLYIFLNKSRQKLKILYWNYNGFILYYKRLESRKYFLPKETQDQRCYEITRKQLSWFLAGLDFSVADDFSSLKLTDYV